MRHATAMRRHAKQKQVRKPNPCGAISTRIAKRQFVRFNPPELWRFALLPQRRAMLDCLESALRSYCACLRGGSDTSRDRAAQKRKVILVTC